MKKFFKPLAFAFLLSLLYPTNLVKSASVKTSLISGDQTQAFQLSESSTLNSYNLIVKTDSKIKPTVRKTANGYELIFITKKNLKNDPFIGIANGSIKSNSDLIDDILITRKPGQLNIRIISSLLNEPRITSSREEVNNPKNANENNEYYNYFVEFIGSRKPQITKHFSSSKQLSTPPSSPIAQSSSVIFNPYRVNLKGPNITLNLDEVDALQALKMLCDSAKYNFVYVKDNPTSLLPSSTSLNESSGTSTSVVVDQSRPISLNFVDMPFSDAFNAILSTSGYQAKLDNNIVYVGTNLTAKPIGVKLSKTYRLNQVTAKAAAEFLGNLGASISFTNTVTTSVSQGVAASESVQGGGTSSTTTSRQNPEVQIYSTKLDRWLVFLVLRMNA